MKIEVFLKNFLKKRKKKIPKKFMSVNYEKRGILDSLELIDLISEIEKKFHISLTGKDFENKKIFFFSGLIKVIKSKVKTVHKKKYN